ncbi:MAG: ATP-dependent DNA helicase RecG [Chloroflexota bacterium]
MNAAIEKLSKVLQLEAARGYDNRAVFGGLEKMMETWEPEVRQLGVPGELPEVVVSRLRDYPQLSPASRAEVLQGIWNRLYQEYPELRPQIADGEGRAGGPQPIKNAVLTEGADASPHLSDLSANTGEPELAPTGVEDEDPLEPEAAADEQLSDEPASLDAQLTTVPGIGPKSGHTLQKLGLETLGDLLWHLPSRYDDYSQLKTINRLWYGEEVTVIGTVEQVSVRTVRGGKMKLVEATIGDGTGSIGVTWFNQAWIASRLKPGEAVVLSGRVDQYLGRLTMNGPEWEPLESEQVHTNRIVPVYPLTAGITAKWLRRVINSVVTRVATRIPDPLPATVLGETGLLPLGTALRQVHFPDSWDQLKQAQRRLAFDELLYLQLGVLRQKQGWVELESEPFVIDQAWQERFLSKLPFQLTDSQHRALQQVRDDLAKPHPMNRLLQGDVGSGKTVIAAAAIGIAASHGAQSALMAPTGILAEQHFSTLRELMPQATGLPAERIELLLGSTPDPEKASIRDRLQSGDVLLVIGTHALLEEPINFARLGLAVIDEQHRFGVAQRAALRSKGTGPHLIVITATPIPRSLALTLYGDLDLTVIDELPPSRLPIETRVLRPIERSRAHNFIRGQLEAGRQAFVIYPLVEGSDHVQASAAVDEHRRLQDSVFPEFQVGLLHGRLKPEEKEHAMEAFRAGELQVLVSTSVIEVGIDVPNATVILIEGANRFGLAQLHQFRGRVGRGPYSSHCLLIPESDSEVENERLKAMEQTSDGFKLSELDLEQRGAGDLLGTRQSGFKLRAARLTDIRLIEKARAQAIRLYERDPQLVAPEHSALAEAVQRFWANGKGEIS